ncbi:protein Flattop [Melanotaenia boesemani]|uniref:protein Flattop n=1 Tax=Melanotaenia boesemani TaxID=1250792 RepID=UPI001C05AAC6|nr:protein Flattop [Melanotaenia boesemani]
MSSNFSSNQFENTFIPKRLQNWCVPSTSKTKTPAARGGHTSFIVDDRGHLLPEVKRGNVYPEFKGTWDLPAHIPVNINPTARSEEGLKRLKLWGFCPPQSGKSLLHKGTKSTNVDEEVGGDEQQDAPSSTDEAQTSSLVPPATGTGQSSEPVQTDSSSRQIQHQA